jgi:hypothetical protein
MSVTEQMPLAEVKNHLSEVVDRLEREHLESPEETLDVMGNRVLLDDIREALAEIDSSGAEVLSRDDALRLNAVRTI